MIKDTIAAIATAMSSSGIGIVRMSGPDSFEIIDKIFQPKKDDKKLSNEKAEFLLISEKSKSSENLSK